MNPFDSNNFPPLPREAQAVYDDAYRMALRDGRVKPDCQRFAMRSVQHAGWYMGTAGWKRLTPDERDNFQMRFATRQPDGTYTIEGVKVFYPNAAKMVPVMGKDGKPTGELKPVPFDAALIRRMISNTNRATQKPGIKSRHPTKDEMEKGIQLPDLGRTVNWRPDPTYMAECDFVDVKPELMADWKARRVNGLSVGFCQDNQTGLNMRFDHVAALSKSQALSALPVLEPFESQTLSQLCFSADSAVVYQSGALSPGVKTMAKKISKECAAAMSQHFGAIHSAYAAMDANEPGADAKLDEANTAYCAAAKQYAAELSPENAVAVDGAAADHPDAAQDRQIADQEIARAQGGGAQFSAEQIEAMTDQQFDAFASEDPLAVMRYQRAKLTNLSAENAARVASDAKAKAEADKAAGRAAFQQFCAEHADQQFDAPSMLAAFDASTTPEAVVALRTVVEKSPKRATTPADCNGGLPIFSAEDMQAIGTSAKEAAKTAVITDPAAKVGDLPLIPQK